MMEKERVPNLAIFGGGEWKLLGFKFILEPSVNTTGSFCSEKIFFSGA
jgi:hypothetical protein